MEAISTDRAVAFPAAGVGKMTDMTWQDWLKLSLAPIMAFLFGRGAQNQKAKMEAIAAEQKSSELLWKRVESLEAKVEANTEKIEKLHGDKMQLAAEIINLKQQIASLEIKKEQYEASEIMHLAQIAALEERLTVKNRELKLAEERLCEMNADKGVKK